MTVKQNTVLPQAVRLRCDNVQTDSKSRAIEVEDAAAIGDTNPISMTVPRAGQSAERRCTA